METKESTLDIPGIIALLNNGSIPPSQRIAWATEYLEQIQNDLPAVIRVEGGVAETISGDAIIIDFDNLVGDPGTCIVCGDSFDDLEESFLDADHPCRTCGWHPDLDLDAEGLAALVRKYALPEALLQQIIAANTGPVRFEVLGYDETESINTGLVGTIDIDYATLHAVLGDDLGPSGDNKALSEWVLKFEDGTVATIYNYKDGVNYLGKGEGLEKEEIRDWHIGGHNKRAAELVHALFEQIKTENE